jgi:predicted transposase YdaD
MLFSKNAHQPRGGKVTRQISNPHDKLFKQFLGEPENAADFLANNLPADLVTHLALRTLQVLQVSFIDAQFIQSEADLLFSVTIANRPGYLYFLFEHQSSPDSFMLLRLIGYMVRVWKRFHRENPVSKRLPVVVPMVLFHGPKGWKGPLSFHDLVESPAESFATCTPAFQCMLYDLSPFGKDELTGSAIIRIMRDLLGAFGRPDFQGRVRKALETMNELMQAPGFARYLEIVFRYILNVFDIPREELGDIVMQTLKPDAKELLMTTAEQLIQQGMKEGMQKGRQEGRQEGTRDVLIRLLSKRFSADAASLEPLLSRLDIEQQGELAEKILDARSLDEIREWLNAICHN